MAAAQPDHPADEQGEAVPVPVAARRLGKSADAIRSAIKRGKLSATRGNDGQWRVFLPIGTTTPETVEPERLFLLADGLRAELEQERRLSADRATTVADLRERVGRLEGEAAGHAAVVQELRAQVQWLRLPWWRRLIG